jgi:hypothetical protein
MSERDDHVYHFTNIAQLPFILATCQLRPGLNQLGTYPDPDFLWATTDARGDKTTSINWTAWRSGALPVVRFTLAAADFEPWSDMSVRYPQWTPKDIERLEIWARSAGVLPSRWRCRVDPLPLERWLLVETRSYVGRWKPFDHRDRQIVDGSSGQDNTRKLIIDGRVYISRQIIEDGRRRYECRSMSMDEFESSARQA